MGKSRIDDAQAWIKACCRPHSHLNIDKLGNHRAVCSGHFVGGNGPTPLHPYPIPVDGSKVRTARLPCKRRTTDSDTSNSRSATKQRHIGDGSDGETATGNKSEMEETGTSTQTDEPWITQVDHLNLLSELHDAKQKIQQLQQKPKTTDRGTQHTPPCKDFGVDAVLHREAKLKKLFEFYTGLTYVRFMALLAFLVPNNDIFTYSENRSNLKYLSNQDGLFITLC